MKNTVFFFISAIVITLLFTGCKKYEEGPSLTLRSVKNRLTNGDWELDKLTVGGVDSTKAYSQLEFGYKFIVSDGMDAKRYTYSQSYTYQGQVVEIDNGYIYFKEDGDVIIFESYSYSYYYYSPIFSNYYSSEIEWDITKLTNKEFWLETKIDGKKVEMQLKKVK